MTPFTDYAAIYDFIGQAVFSEQLAAQVLDWVGEQGWRDRPYAGQRVLDLACGTGAAALVFAAAGCTVVGVDHSAEMLEQARRKAERHGGDIQFIRQDMRQLTVPADNGSEGAVYQPQSFDFITCFDGLDHLSESDDLQRVCAGVAELLRPGGYFIFDMATETAFNTWFDRDLVVYDDPDYMVYHRLDYDPRHRRGTRRVVWFTREIERWWRSEELHILRNWSDVAVQAVLHSASLEVLTRMEQGERAIWFVRRGQS